MWARFSALVIWSVVAATVVGWALQLGVRGPAVPPAARVATAAPAAGSDLSRLLGLPPPEAPPPAAEAPAAAPADARFKLLGVVAPQPGRMAGLALISVDGQAPKAVAVGRDLEPGLRVLRVAHRQVALGPSIGQPASVTLELPALPEPARGRPGEGGAVGQPPAGVVAPGMPAGAVPAAGLPAIGGLPPNSAPQPGAVQPPRPAATGAAVPGAAVIGALPAAAAAQAAWANQAQQRPATRPGQAPGVAGNRLPSVQAMTPAQGAAPPPAQPVEGDDLGTGGSAPAALR